MVAVSAGGAQDTGEKLARLHQAASWVLDPWKLCIYAWRCQLREREREQILVLASLLVLPSSLVDPGVWEIQPCWVSGGGEEPAWAGTPQSGAGRTTDPPWISWLLGSGPCVPSRSSWVLASAAWW